jgi:hypothetical protein
LSDGGIRNDYTLRILNKGAKRTFALDVSGLPSATVNVAGISHDADGNMIVEVGQDQTREIRVSVQVGSTVLPKVAVDIEFKVTDTITKQDAAAKDHFVPVDRK